jgi:hypothetical protein
LVCGLNAGPMREDDVAGRHKFTIGLTGVLASTSVTAGKCEFRKS